MKFLCVIISLTLIFTITAVAQNRVLQLDGQGDYVQLPDNIFNDLDEATIEAWVKWEEFRYFSQPFGFVSGAKWSVMAVNNAGYSSDLQYFIYINMKLYSIRATDILQLNQWYHIAVVSGKAGMKLYINGGLVGSHNYNDDLSHRLSTGVQLQTALHALEVAARKNNFRLLSRVAAVLHDTLKHNPIEGFSRAQLLAFQKACQEAIIDPSKASPRASERHLFRAQLSWLPSLPDDVLEQSAQATIALKLISG